MYAEYLKQNLALEFPLLKEYYPNLHNPRFDFNDDALEAGIEMQCEVARRFAALWNKGV